MSSRLAEEVGVATARFVKTGITPDEYDQMREKLGVGDTPRLGAFSRGRGRRGRKDSSL